MVPKPFRSLRNQQITNPKNIRHSSPGARPRKEGGNPMTIMSNGDFRKLMNATMRLSASCRKCGRPIQFEGGANLARDSGIHGSVVQCSTCRSVYTVDVGVDRLMLVADVTADYPAGTPPRHPLFNPPPGWLAPPPNWTPPAGWQPDPSWPPPPPDWQFWVPGRFNPPPGWPPPLPDWEPPAPRGHRVCAMRGAMPLLTARRLRSCSESRSRRRPGRDGMSSSLRRG